MAKPFLEEVGRVDSSAERDAATRAFRVHRHDVQNHLQLVKAYIQLNRPSDALSAVDRLAHWLTSLSLVQNHLGGESAAILWAAAQCPNIVIEQLMGPPPLYEVHADTVVELLTRLQGVLAETGTNVKLSLRVTANDTPVFVEISGAEEIRHVWNNGHMDGSVQLEWR